MMCFYLNHRDNAYLLAENLQLSNLHPCHDFWDIQFHVANNKIQILSSSLYLSLNLSLSLRDRDRADTIITLYHTIQPPETF